jgi:aldehyde dehydrogenase (NAD+)
MLELPFDHILFTGSTRIGKQIMTAAAKHLTPVTLELGGQSPVIVDETADANVAAERVAWGKFLNAGQTCVAPNHVFVHVSKEKEFIAALKAVVAKRFGATEDDRARSTSLARMVDTNTCAKLAQVVEATVAAGAVLECGGRADVPSRYLAPTVLSGVNTTMAAMKEELFGPILPVIAYSDIKAVYADIQSRGKPLALYAFSEDTENVEAILDNTSAGGTVINNVIIHLGNPNLPFGGVGDSGFGNYHGEYGFRTFSHERAVLTQGRLSLVKYFYPPYGRLVNRLVQALTWFFSR